jgi:hypothetical protein
MKRGTEQSSQANQSRSDAALQLATLAEHHASAAGAGAGLDEHTASAPSRSALPRAKEESMKYYQVDADMMGSEWTGTKDDLRDFCEVLGRMVPDVEIVAVTDSCNGAENSVGVEISDDVWNEAIKIHASETTHPVWRC